MVNSCVVYGCSNCSNRDKKSFFLIPTVIVNHGEKRKLSSERRWAQFISNLRRDHFTPSKHTRICSDHFISGTFLFFIYSVIIRMTFVNSRQTCLQCLPVYMLYSVLEQVLHCIAVRHELHSITLIQIYLNLLGNRLCCLINHKFILKCSLMLVTWSGTRENHDKD